MMQIRSLRVWLFVLGMMGIGLAATPDALAQRGSIVEDRAARKLLEAGDARYDADETSKALDIWQSVIERYPRSKVRFDAHMRLGEHMLSRDRAHDQARKHFELAASEDNNDQEMRAEATLKMGVCFYESRNFGKSFQIMREVIEKFPVSQQVNSAYYYIGLGHFQLGHYSRAIAALEKVGTALGQRDESFEKLEAGKRLFVKIEDADLAALPQNQTVKVRVKAKSGDEEVVECFSVGRNVRLVLGSITTVLGKPKRGNGVLEIRGGDVVETTYVDRHTADRQFDRPVMKEVRVVGEAVVQIMDGAFSESLQGVVLGKEANLQITDADHDTSDKADSLKAAAKVYREKTQAELETELADLVAKGAVAPPSEGGPVSLSELMAEGEDGDGPRIDRYKLIDETTVTLREANAKDTASGEQPGQPAAPAPAGVDAIDAPALPGESTGAAAAAGLDDITAAIAQDLRDDSVHTGIFRATLLLEKSETPNADDDVLQALPGDQVRLTYLDKLHTGEGPRDVIAKARVVEGNLGGVRVTRTEIGDRRLKLETELKTAGALTQIGNRYKEFGLKQNANAKYEQALQVCEAIMQDARKLGGRVLEETYVQLWRIYFEMGKLELASAMCQRLQREFPQSGFVDEAMLQLAHVARKKGELNRAVGLYKRLVGIETSQLRGEAQFGVAECYEAMAKQATGPQGVQLFDRAFQEYKKVFDQYPDSGRVGEAVAKMAYYYYQQKDYARAIDVFETVLSEYPDAKFLDVILFNYGRCLFRMDRKLEARRKFDALIGEFPESALAADAKRISEALVKAGF